MASIRATGVLARPDVMVTTSPLWACLTRLERFVFASNMLAVIMAASSCQHILAKFRRVFKISEFGDEEMLIEVCAFPGLRSETWGTRHCRSEERRVGK